MWHTCHLKKKLVVCPHTFFFFCIVQLHLQSVLFRKRIYKLEYAFKFFLYMYLPFTVHLSKHFSFPYPIKYIGCLPLWTHLKWFCSFVKIASRHFGGELVSWWRKEPEKPYFGLYPALRSGAPLLQFISVFLSIILNRRHYLYGLSFSILNSLFKLYRTSFILHVQCCLISNLSGIRKYLNFTSAQGSVLSTMWKIAQEVLESVIQHLHFFPKKLLFKVLFCLFIVCWKHICVKWYTNILR